jgi:hypothetical protein
MDYMFLRIVWKGDLNNMMESHYWRRLDWKRLGMIVRLIDTSDSEEFWIRFPNLPTCRFFH